MEPTSTSGGQEKSPSGNTIALSAEAKAEIRKALIDDARGFLNIPYKYGAEWKDFSVIPVELDCSESVEGWYARQKLKIPDGAQAQFNFTIPTDNPQPGDLAFFGRGGNITKVYHVGLLFDAHNIIEARGYDPNASFETGKVILRPRLKWENYKPNFVGYRAHPKLA